MKKKLILTLCIFYFGIINAQSLIQNVRGNVIDKDSGMTIPGVNVTITSTNPIMGQVTDMNGIFKIKNVPTGKIDIVFSAMGYKPVRLNKVILLTNKELILNIQMVEMIEKLDEVVVKAKKNTRKKITSIAPVSARSFNVEETNKYAGSFGDPSRMVQNFAGVNSAGDQRNDIVIRGNSPFGVLWKINGLNIHNPNHFGALGTNGGAFPILNNNILASSNFFTAAFPSKYGNAVAGVFDIKTRNGNNENHEFTGQLGFNGFELGAEGPLYNGGSYIVSGRYSMLGFFKILGINIGTSATPKYQDLTFKINLPLNQNSKISFWGIGGNSNIDILKKDQKNKDFAFTKSSTIVDIYFKSRMASVGTTYTLFYNKNIKQEINVGYSGSQTINQLDSLKNDKKFNTIAKEKFYHNDSYEHKLLASYDLNIKFNSKNKFNIGANIDHYNFSYTDSIYRSNTKKYIVLSKNKGTTSLVQSYANLQHRFTDDLVINTGLYFQHLTLNNKNAIEPRLNLKYQISHTQSLSFGAGLHSQMFPLIFYLKQDDKGKKTNKYLDFYKSIHYVLGYNYSFTTQWNFKIETYFQDLYDVPVSPKQGHYSLLNEGSSFNFKVPNNLINKGVGQNYGVDITLEKYLSDNYYMMLTTSLYESKYKGNDGIERSTLWAGNYSVTALAGMEFDFNTPTLKQNIGFNLRFNLNGGNRYIPVNLKESKIQKKEVKDLSSIYVQKYDDYMRLDLKIYYKLDTKYISQEWGIDLQNVTNRKNIFRKRYDESNQRIVTEYQLGILPVVFYRIYF